MSIIDYFLYLCFSFKFLSLLESFRLGILDSWLIDIANGVYLMMIIKKTPFLPNGNSPITEMVVAHAVWTVNDAWVFRHNAMELFLIYV